MDRSKVFSGILLLALGIYFLIFNMGIITVHPLSLLRFWPLLLVAIGISVMLGSKPPWWLVVVLIVVLVAIIGMSFVFMPARSVGELTLSRPAVETATGILYRLELSAGRFDVKGRTTRGANITYIKYDGIAPLYSIKEVGSTLSVQLNDRVTSRFVGNRLSGLPNWISTRGNQWDMDINDQLPVDIDLHAGAGKFTIDASDLILQGLNVQAGVGDVTLVLPSTAATRRVNVEVKMGIGNITLVLPREAAVLIRYNKGIGSSGLMDRGFARSGDNYFSPLWQTDTSSASVEYTIVVDIGIGNLDVKWRD